VAAHRPCAWQVLPVMARTPGAAPSLRALLEAMRAALALEQALGAGLSAPTQAVTAVPPSSAAAAAAAAATGSRATAAPAPLARAGLAKLVRANPLARPAWEALLQLGVGTASAGAA
jgi:cytosine/adenosine deaminase-related metal-dependent hydrolase